MTKEELMHRAIELSKNSVKTGGGPFGAVIAKDGIIIAEASNSVTEQNIRFNLKMEKLFIFQMKFYKNMKK